MIATSHPSAIRRAPDEATRAEETERSIADLRKVAQRLSELSPGRV